MLKKDKACDNSFMDYYKKTLEDIYKLIDEKKNDEARSLIEEELKQVYIPRDFEEEIKKILDEIGPKVNYLRALSDEGIEEYLFSTREKQLLAVDALNSKNLRDYIDICNKYLCSDGFINAKVLLIESLIRQEISEDVKYVQDGMEYEFIPRFCLLPEESDGFLEGIRYLEEIYLKDPSKLQMAKELLYKEVMLNLPLNLEGEEGIESAKGICDFIEKAFQNRQFS
ncbi:MAG: DUF3196 family protein [Erysipelotrichaceae bacterium]|nr:DUF3196 family protein [Erysipelotrichaceae bacterium]